MGFSTQKGFLSWFIRWATVSPASHSFLVYKSNHFKRHMVLEVQGRGFVQVPWDHWCKKNKLLALYRVERDDEQVQEAFHKLGNRLGDVYDTFSLIGFLLIYVARLWESNKVDSKEKLICSEMVALFLSWATIPINVDITRIVPKDLWRLAIETPDTFTERYESKRAQHKLKRVRKKGKLLLDPNDTSAGD